MDNPSKPQVRRPDVPLAFREIHVPLPVTLALIGAGLAVLAWLLRQDLRSLALGEALPLAQTWRLAGYFFLVAGALSAVATLFAFRIRPLTVQKPQLAAAPRKRQFWDKAEVELTPRRGRNSTPPRRWIFLCCLTGFSLLVSLAFAPGLYSPVAHWLFWAVAVSGLALGAVIGYEAAHRWRFSGSVFRMKSDFAVIGDTLQGCVFIRPALAPERGFRVRLRGVKITHCRRGADSEEAVWLDESVIVAPLPEEGGGCAVPVCFEIPDHCPPTGQVSSHTHVEWFIEVSADTPAINCRVSFEVPVYAGEKPKRRPAPKRDALLAPFEREVDGRRLNDNPQIRMRTLPGGDTEYYFPARPVLGLTLLCLLALGVIAPALIDQYALPLIDNNMLTEILKDFWQIWLIIPLAFILTIIFAGPDDGLWGPAHTILRHLRATRIQAGSGCLILTANWLGFKRTRSFPADFISSIDLYWNKLSGDVLCYDLILKTLSEEKVLLATLLRGKPESRWIMEQMRRELFPPLTSVDRPFQEPDPFADGRAASTPPIDIPARTALSSSPAELEQQLTYKKN